MKSHFSLLKMRALEKYDSDIMMFFIDNTIEFFTRHGHLADHLVPIIMAKAVLNPKCSVDAHGLHTTIDRMVKYLHWAPTVSNS